jgi:hypothetical protein
MEKEQWKDEVMNSLRGMNKAEPNAFLFTRIEAKMQKTVMMPRWQLSLSAIVLALLLAANALIVFKTAKKSNQPAANEYSLTSFQAY